MRALRRVLTSSLLLLAVACEGLTGIDSTDPTNLTYSVTGSTSPGEAPGVLLTWDPPRARDAWTYAVYGRESTYGEWYLVGITTSPTFHDGGPQQRQYYVAARDEDDYEFGRSRTVTIERVAPLGTPGSLTSVSLDGALHLAWSDAVRMAAPSRFLHYRVYATAHTPQGGCVLSQWTLVGTTTAEEFLLAGLANGVTRCVALSAVARDGGEGARSQPRIDTPRPDARHVRVDALQASAATAGFQFHDPARAVYGVVVEGASPGADFRVERAGDGSLLLRATRDAVRIATHGTAPIADLTLVDVAPASGYTATEVTALPGMAYVFRITRTDGVRYGVVRIGYVTPEYVVLDWAYQAAVGNPELLIGVVE